MLDGVPLIDARVHAARLPNLKERRSVMRGAVAQGPATAFEVVRRVFLDELSDHQLRFALAETTAHLEHLVDEACAECLDGDVVRYRGA